MQVAVLGMSSSKKMKVDDLITDIIKEAQHHLINNEQTKTTKSVLTTLGKKWKVGKQCNPSYLINNLIFEGQSSGVHFIPPWLLHK